MRGTVCDASTGSGLVHKIRDCVPVGHGWSLYNTGNGRMLSGSQSTAAPKIAPCS
ncbi:hypothetical protein RGQ15_16560 [Paracoccus sp. MBLB3053]|uniref:Uncharacterized protein n=1 Tax=Paracoccus aurantius TaxID=3073814 RepID=A0ABU2HY00_9RHOB|nr:hypothetical protein [Paracoccus sp. MBLB3053]MDS9469174.1 hypothetical protein [Paracoccus sp. MBLB3053]